MQYTACVGWDSRPVGMWYLLAQKLRGSQGPLKSSSSGLQASGKFVSTWAKNLHEHQSSISP